MVALPTATYCCCYVEMLVEDPFMIKLEESEINVEEYIIARDLVFFSFTLFSTPTLSLRLLQATPPQSQ